MSTCILMMGWCDHSRWHMKSKWNGIRKMSGIPAKTYSIWNGWNPPGITWNPHGIHMESIWNPYGIWEQGKDLLGSHENMATMNCCSKTVDIMFLNGLAEVLVHKVNDTYWDLVDH